MVNTLAVDNEAKHTIEALRAELQKTQSKLQAVEELKGQSGMMTSLMFKVRRHQHWDKIRDTSSLFHTLPECLLYTAFNKFLDVWHGFYSVCKITYSINESIHPTSASLLFADVFLAYFIWYIAFLNTRILIVRIQKQQGNITLSRAGPLNLYRW